MSPNLLFRSVTMAVWLAASGVAVDAAEPAVFTDQASELGVRFRHTNGGTGEFYFPEISGTGAALFDYDRDGDLDLYISQSGSLDAPEENPDLGCDQLYRNDLVPDGTGVSRPRFVLVTATSGLDACGYGTGVAVGDIDNDGWPDLYLAQFGPNQMWKNRGDGTFVEVQNAGGAAGHHWTVPTAFLDYDDDGYLDLFVGNYAKFRLANQKSCVTQTGVRDYCGPKAYLAETDRLYRNRGDGTFEETTLASGLDGDAGYALGVVPADFNSDGRMDLYVANDGVANHLWINQGDGTFLDDALLSGSAVNTQGQPEASMGVSAADFDDDGDLDLFMTHLANETNTIYVNDGTATFDDRSITTGLAAPSWKYTGFGTGFFDYDNDGRLDLLCVNGGVTVVEELVQQRDPFPYHQSNQLFRNAGGGRFEEVDGGAAVSVSEVSRGAAFGDIDNDGDTDVVVHNNNGPLQILINNVGHANAWSGFKLLAANSQSDALGAKVRVTPVSGPERWRSMQVAGSYASSSDPRVLVGLGAKGDVQQATVYWPGGRRQSWQAIPAGRHVVVHQTP